MVNGALMKRKRMILWPSLRSGLFSFSFVDLLHMFQDVEASRQLMVTLISLAEANHEIQFIMAFRPRNVEVTWIECGYLYH